VITAWPADANGSTSGSIVAGVSQAPGTMTKVDMVRSSGAKDTRAGVSWARSSDRDLVRASNGLSGWRM
jgi:hypothetical protein